VPGRSGHLRDSVLVRVQARWPGASVVHRLDLDTTGVILFATEQSTWHHFRRAFENHTARKMYHAIVAGKLTGSDRLILDLRIAQHSPARVKVIDEKIIPKPPGTRRCDLTWRAIASTPSPGTPGEGRGGGNLELRTQNLELEGCPHPNPPPEYQGRGKDNIATLLEIHLGTGFLHQIRVMLAHVGHPVLGDKTYGEPNPEIPRQMLHARSIRIGDIYAESPEPPDFTEALSLLRLHK
jgi:23S rRNA-/tRNA-specific pseudouridylate synthase